MVIRGMIQNGFQGRGWFGCRIERSRDLSNDEKSVVVCCGNTSIAETCTELHMMFMILMGFLAVALLLIGVLLWLAPGRCARMFRLVRRPVLLFKQRPARRFLSSAWPWWCNPIMAPPGQAEPTRCRRSRPLLL